MHRVIVLDDVAQEGLDLLDAAEGIEYEIRTGLEGRRTAQGAGRRSTGPSAAAA